MTDKTRTPEPQRKVSTKWDASVVPPAEFVTEMNIQSLGEVFYLTFGQVVLPNSNPEPSATALTATIRPTARYAIPKAAFQRMLKVFELVANDLDNDEGDDK